MVFVPQVFAVHDLGVVALLILLEGLLSADNALVLALMVRHLEGKQRKKALTYGLAGAFVFRLIAIALASKILQLWWLQFIGAAYLIFLVVKHFVGKASDKDASKSPDSFWKTVIAVEITDIAFAVDSILAGVAMIHNESKMWVVYVGGITGVVLLRFAATVFIRLLHKYPVLDHVAYALVGWAGVKLAFVSGNSFEKVNPGVIPFDIPSMPAIVFWTGMALIGVVGTVLAARGKSNELEEEQPDAS